MFKITKSLMFPIILIITLITIASTAVIAFLASKEEIESSLVIGNVLVEVEAFYQRGEDILPIDITEIGGGVIELNITSPEQLEHFDNFRVNIKVYSSVFTYFRVAVVEQFTLTYVSGEQTTVVAVVKDEFSQFAYNVDDFFDNRLQDEFFYYQSKVKRVNENTPYIIEFIGQLPEIDFHPIYEGKYTLQIGFQIDAVQYLNGPQINWGLENPPWMENGGW